jgi:hypothetical protein
MKSIRSVERCGKWQSYLGIISQSEVAGFLHYVSLLLPLVNFLP